MRIVPYERDALSSFACHLRGRTKKWIKIFVRPNLEGKRKLESTNTDSMPPRKRSK
uniref:AlNc14C32G2966 protein n=1 Tax=Albugo laibachii Nc14 TaxID=890382 RepID=F0W816_9STRA|nr:AlNc14C32G2966 [Albugo laibachii Nc14]|eukprot:CCA17269.1 AlNc14C32G2966 [Albugo laibachii Nc14]